MATMAMQQCSQALIDCSSKGFIKEGHQDHVCLRESLQQIKKQYAEALMSYQDSATEEMKSKERHIQ